MMRVFLLLAGLFVLGLAGPALAVNPDEMLPDPVLEARAREIGRDLRCLVCQNQSIDDSDADLARDLRRLVRERLKAGDSDTAAKQYLVDRYGDYVLLKPPFKPGTYALWLGPLVILAGAIFVGLTYYRRRAKESSVPLPLSAEEQAALHKLLRQPEDEV